MFYEFINHNSALIALIFFVAGVAFFGWKNKSNLIVLLTALLVVTLAMFAFFNAQYGSSDVNDFQEFDRLIESDAPFIVQIYSDSCGMCLLSKSIVDQLDRNIEGKLILIRLNISEEVGSMVARRYQVSATPTFFVFDRSGNVAFRQSGYPDITKLEKTALKLTSS